MPSIFTDKKPGDVLTARDYNELQMVARRLSRMKGGRGIDVRHTSTQFDQSSHTPHIQHVLEILTVVVAGEEYRGALRFFDHSNDQWSSVTSGQRYTGNEFPAPTSWLIDASESLLDFNVSDLVICYWDRQRQAFIPTETVGHPLIDVTGSESPITGQSSQLIGDFNHFDITAAITYTFNPGGQRFLMNNRQMTRTVKKHQDDGAQRQESMGVVTTWFNENTDNNQDDIFIGMAATSGRVATVASALRIELLRGNREAQVVRALGSPVVDNTVPISLDVLPSAVTNDFIGGASDQVFQLSQTHVHYVRVRPPLNTNTRFVPGTISPKWTIRCDAQFQFTYV